MRKKKYRHSFPKNYTKKLRTCFLDKELLLGINISIGGFNEFIRDNGITDVGWNDWFEVNSAGFCSHRSPKKNGENTVFFLWIQNNDLPVLTHEVLHLVILILRKLNLPLSEETEEIYAHLMSDLIRQICEVEE